MEPEAAILRRATAAALTGGEPDVASLFEHDIDWDDVLSRTRYHGVLAPVRTVLKCAGEPVPAKVLRAVDDEYEALARRNLHLTNRLFTVLDLLADHDVDALAFKGPAIARSVHGGLTSRPFTDIDLLVRPSEVERAASLLRSAGYRDVVDGEPHPELTPLEWRAKAEGGYAYPLARSPQDMIELHWRVVNKRFRFSVLSPEVFDSPGTVAIQGRTVPVLPDEHRLVGLCLHGRKHVWSRVKWLWDVAAYVETNPALDWGAVLGIVRARGCERMVTVPVSMAATTFGIQVPTAVARAVAVDPVAQDMLEWLDPAHVLSQDGPTGLDHLRFDLRALNRWADRLYFLESYLTRPTVRDAHHLPGSLPYPVSRLFRLGRVVKNTTTYPFRRTWS